MPKDIASIESTESDECSEGRSKKQLLPLFALTPFTMLDFPGRTSCVVWFSGCNMRCPYCHNPQIIKSKGRGDVEQAMAFLRRRVGLLDGVVFSGGEATLYPGLMDMMRNVRSMGFEIKLDTNGTRPEIVQSILREGLVDYLALDYKAPQQKFKAVSGSKKYNEFKTSLSMLCAQQDVDFEIRTTVHTDLMDEDDLNAIMDDLEAENYKGTYYIQNFRHDPDNPTLACLPEQSRMLERKLIRDERAFSVEYRNF